MELRLDSLSTSSLRIYGCGYFRPSKMAPATGTTVFSYLEIVLLLPPPVLVVTFFSQNSEFEVSVHTFILKMQNFDFCDGI